MRLKRVLDYEFEHTNFFSVTNVLCFSLPLKKKFPCENKLILFKFLLEFNISQVRCAYNERSWVLNINVFSGGKQLTIISYHTKVAYVQGICLFVHGSYGEIIVEISRAS